MMSLFTRDHVLSCPVEGACPGCRHLVRQPLTLQSMAIKRLGDWVALQTEKMMPPISRLWLRYPTKAEQLLSEKIEIMRNHLQRTISWMFYDNLVTEVKRALTLLLKRTKLFHRCLERHQLHRGYDNTDNNSIVVITRMIETLFTDNLTVLSFTEDTWVVFQESFYLKSNMLTGLTHLDVIQNQRNINITQLLKELHNLKCLSLHNIDSDHVLECIADNCKLIEILHLSFPDMNDYSINILVQLRHLRSVDLRSKTVSKIGIAKLLTSCENIEHIFFHDLKISSYIDGMYMDLVGSALEYIESFERDAGKQFKLKSYEHTINTMLRLQLVIKMCPLIKKISLTKFNTAVNLNYVHALKDLHDLSELELLKFDFHTDQMKEVLHAKGGTLIQLIFKKVTQIDINALKYIFQVCPNLQSLTLSFTVILNRASYGLFLCESQTPPLRYLKKLTLIREFCPKPSDDLLIFLLSNCPNVEFIDVKGVSLLKDSIMSEVLDKNPKQLMYLKELRMQDKLSMLVIDRIVQNCTNPPEIITYYEV